MAGLSPTCGTQYLLAFLPQMRHTGFVMKKCIICRTAFEPNGNANRNKQLTCTDQKCQRALKTIRQTLRREMSAKKKVRAK